MPPGYRFESNDYDKYQLILVQSGILKIRVHNKDIGLVPGALAILKAGSAFQLSSSDGYSGLGIIVENPSQKELTGKSRAAMANVQILTTAELIEHYLLTPDRDSKRSIRGLALAMIWQTSALEKKQLARQSEKWPEIARGVLDVNLGTGAPARQLLSHIPLCYRQLSRLFKTAYGMSPKQYQVAARVKAAKRMLASSDTNVTETALELGFSSSQHFATQFKKETGMTPREFTLTTAR